jgi:hypothetical protein
MIRSVVSLISLLAVAVTSATSLDTAHATAMSAENLFTAYHRNELDADSKYLGKRISVGGVVERVGKNEDGDPYVILEPGVLCKFSEAFNKRIAQLQPKSMTGIGGTVIGLKGGRVVLKDCSF